VKRAIQRLLRDPLAEKILTGDVTPGDALQVDAASGALTFGKP
jgi:ATP-dependent Clp protease ATP-binding subunit ClpA